VTILVCLGPTPETWWQAKNLLGETVLDRAEELATDEVTQKAIFDGKVAQALDIHGLAAAVRERVWAAVEEAAKQVSTSPQTLPNGSDWPTESIQHVAELGREMELRRRVPDRPGIW
jgi:hypothetical protein